MKPSEPFGECPDGDQVGARLVGLIKALLHCGEAIIRDSRIAFDHVRSDVRAGRGGISKLGSAGLVLEFGELAQQHFGVVDATRKSFVLINRQMAFLFCICRGKLFRKGDFDRFFQF